MGYAQTPYAAVEAQMREAVAAGTPSLSAAAIDDGRVVWLHAEGWADVEAGTAASPDTIYRIGSVSKSITGTVIALAAHNSAIDLAQPVCVRTLAARRPRCGAATLSDAINMSGGMPQAVFYPGIAGSGLSLSAAQFLDQFALSVTGAGARYDYSNMGPALAVRAVEVAIDEPFAPYAQRTLLDPLGMTSTFFAMRDAPHGRRAASYSRQNRRFERDYETLPAPSAGMVSSARDLTSFALAHLGASQQVVNDAHIQTLHTPRTLGFYAFGWGRIAVDGWAFLVSDGQVNGGQAIIILEPSRRAGSIVLANVATDHVSELALVILDAAAPGAAEAFERGVRHIEERLAAAPRSALADASWSRRGWVHVSNRRLSVALQAREDGKLDISIGPQRLHATAVEAEGAYARWSLPCPEALPACADDGEAVLSLTEVAGGVAGVIAVTTQSGQFPYALHAE
jgi:CubicO group peptidase (beta-lactamase class C family)